MDQKSDEARLAKMLTAISLQERTESASVERRFVPMADGRVSKPHSESYVRLSRTAARDSSVGSPIRR
jgi:hypothetical protein